MEMEPIFDAVINHQPAQPDHDYFVGDAKKNEYQKNECKACFQRFPSWQALRAHYQSHHSVQSRNCTLYKCPFCLGAFSDAFGFENHLNSHLPINTGSMACPFCKTNFRYKDSLAHHIQVCNKRHQESQKRSPSIEIISDDDEAPTTSKNAQVVRPRSTDTLSAASDSRDRTEMQNTHPLFQIQTRTSLDGNRSAQPEPSRPLSVEVVENRVPSVSDAVADFCSSSFRLFPNSEDRPEPLSLLLNGSQITLDGPVAFLPDLQLPNERNVNLQLVPDALQLLSPETPSSDSSDAAQFFQAQDSTAAWLATQPKLHRRACSGYTLFSSENRKQVMLHNPGASFGEISRLVGYAWKCLSKPDKDAYFRRAKAIVAAREEIESLMPNTLKPGEMHMFECDWRNCGEMFPEENTFIEHINWHLGNEFISETMEFGCFWQGCLKYRFSKPGEKAKPFDSRGRLMRHVRDMHVSKSLRVVNSDTQRVVVNESEQVQVAQPAPSTSQEDLGNIFPFDITFIESQQPMETNEGQNNATLLVPKQVISAQTQQQLQQNLSMSQQIKEMTQATKPPTSANYPISEFFRQPRQTSGYIYFSSQIRQRIADENPGATFGELSKLCGFEWRKLPADQKMGFAQLELEKNNIQAQIEINEKRIYMCKWRQCAKQFSDPDEYMRHVMQHTDHMDTLTGPYACNWKLCFKYTQGARPFSSVMQLRRHMIDKHVRSKTSYEIISDGPSSSSQAPATSKAQQNTPPVAPATTVGPATSVLKQLLAVTHQPSPPDMERTIWSALSPALSTGEINGMPNVNQADDSIAQESSPTNANESESQMQQALRPPQEQLERIKIEYFEEQMENNDSGTSEFGL